MVFLFFQVFSTVETRCAFAPLAGLMDQLMGPWKCILV